MDSKNTDREFYKIFSIVMIFIIVLTILIAILSNVFASYSLHPSEQYKKEIQKRTDQRTKPVANINLASNPTIKQETPIITASSSKLSGEEVYNVVCMSCHTSGVAGAPVIGKSDQWAERIAQGKQSLYSNAINGIGVMPAKGGASNLSDDNIKAAVDYIISESN
jgi:cytochrome c5